MCRSGNEVIVPDRAVWISVRQPKRKISKILKTLPCRNYVADGKNTGRRQLPRTRSTCYITHDSKFGFWNKIFPYAIMLKKYVIYPSMAN